MILINKMRLTLEGLSRLEIVLLFLIGLGVLSILYLLVSIVLALIRKRKSGVETLEEAVQYAPPSSDVGEPQPEAHEEKQEEPKTEKEKLQRKEDDLRKRETRFKDERRKELERKEKLILSRKNITESTFGFDEGEGGFGGEGELEKEKVRLENFIKAAEERYGRGELSDQNFRKIVSDYQQQLIELDVKMRREKTDNLDL